MGFFSDAWDSVKNVVSDPLDSIQDTVGWVFPTVLPTKESAGTYATAAGLAGAGASALGALGGGTAASLGKGGALPQGTDAALGAGGMGLMDYVSTAGDLIGGASNFLGSSGLGDLIAGYAAGDWQKEINQKQLDWAKEQSEMQRYAANTRYQAAVRDMRKAGINPMLAYKQGGAAMPGGTSLGQLGNPIQAGVNSATQLRKSMNDTALAQASVKQTAEQIQKIKAEVPLTETQTRVAAQTISRVNAETANIQAKTLSQDYANALDQIIAEAMDSEAIKSAFIATRVKPSMAGAAAVAASMVEEAVKSHKITADQGAVIKQNQARRLRNANRRKR